MDKAGEGPRTTIVDRSGFIVIIGIWLWLFSIGYLHLTFWRGVLAIILWPYYLGTAFSPPH